MNTFLRVLFVAGLLSMPVFVSALTQAEIQSQLQVLLNQVKVLQQELAQQQAATPAQTTSAQNSNNNTECPHISRVLKRGMSGDDVTRLQEFLSQDASVYPEGTVSGFYGALTEAAVQRWQSKFKIVSEGTPESTGFGVVGPRTAALMALQCSGGSTGTTGMVGGFIKITPVSGSAPLLVTAEVTINSTRSCSATTYTLDWGDGTGVQNIPLPANTCAEAKQTFTHTYSYAGNYSVTLSAQGHSTTATVVVAGPTNPNGNAGSTGGVGTPDIFSVNATTGDAPLQVTFSGTINGSGSCGGGFYTLLFGDTQTQTLTYPSQCSPQSFSIAHNYSSPGTYNAVLFRGAVGSTVVGNIQIKPTASVSNYQSPTLTPNMAGVPRAVSLQFDIPTPCTGYDVDWGDGTSRVTQGQSSCGASSHVQTLTHTYAGPGAFVITIKRGSSLERTDTISISISG